MAKKDFPQLIHVTAEKDTDGSTLLLAHMRGVADIAEIDQPVECALYKLIKVGRVISSAKWVEK